MTRVGAAIPLVLGCAVAACQQVHPATPFAGLEIVVQRVNEQRLLGEGVTLAARVEGPRAHMTVLGPTSRGPLEFTLETGTAEPGIAAGPLLIPWPPGRPVPPEVTTVARLTRRVLIWEPHTSYSLRVLGVVRLAMALVGLVLIGALLDGLGLIRSRRRTPSRAPDPAAAGSAGPRGSAAR